ncbi:TIGR01548 family HAD-type hydrolase [Oscillatoria sp. FACHB-1406]|uniref:TIGR01548 family HAD-type hydrolase n=1 Tax=Oscillatoria sp. FACHB-1406 TaxID=2692846 RepID=UPI0016829E11|nr:TIGR01548 family HAD-type hydrolase [Oscillatoria sp. FACHB-1406]MBD2577810.1 TIGR01548 family HAD-type hydrolase [Oscillatoria sp. FACHB-1406]
MVASILVFDIDGVVRDVGGSYRRAIADTVEHFSDRAYRPTMEEIDRLKSEGIWNNDWAASQELVARYGESQGRDRETFTPDYNTLIAYFQSRYRGSDPVNWDGYITTEPLLLQAEYLENLSKAGIAWGFFSGATRGSAEYVLKKRLGLDNPVLIAMEDAPGKPDPTGLFAAVEQLETTAEEPVFYVGDTVADMYTVNKARELRPTRRWIGVGVLPPHIQGERAESYARELEKAGAEIVLKNVEELTPERLK